MKNLFLLALCVLGLNTYLSFGITKVQSLLTENLTNPIGLDIASPRFSWKLFSDQRNVMQTAYELRVSDEKAYLTKASKLIWHSRKVLSDSSIFVAYRGPKLKSDTRYSWQVRVWDNSGKVSEWSAPAFWQTAFFAASDWKAKWITQHTETEACPIFRKKFVNGKQIQSATAHITALGLYEAQINGQRIGDAWFTPGWTSYKKRLQYQTYDVTNLVKQGQNAIGVTIGNGWFKGNLGGFEDITTNYGKNTALLFQLVIRYSDGTSETLISDESWKSSTGSIKSSDIYNGESIDNRDEKPGWTLPDYNDSAWANAKLLDDPKLNLVATYNEPVREHEEFKPLKIFKTPSGEQVVDFGQNLVGYERIRLSGKAGTKITIQHAEILDKAGNFYTENLRKAKSTNEYILKGEGVETFQPHFTFHGFRYIKIEGYEGELKPEDITAVALYSDMKPTGTFSCSNPLINQLQSNIIWGQKGNFLDVPTDCPQRDERLGWTGDAQAFSRTATFNMDVHNFFVKWMKDVALDQFASGALPHVVPDVWGEKFGGSAGWSDVATILPWNMYLAYGDLRILTQQYSSMKAWVEYMKSQSKNNLWNTGSHFGDWLFYSPGADDWGYAAVTDNYLIAQCFWAHSTQLLINTAEVLEKKEDVLYYSNLLKTIKEAFLKEYVTPNGRLLSATQTAYVLALQFDMLPENQRGKIVDELVKNIEYYRNHLTTGFLGTPYLCHVLSRFGKTEVAYQLLLQETYPSWLYPVKMGATTIWERWDGIKPDGNLQTPTMNSYNHYAYGAIGDWMYRVVTGIDTETDSPGYKKITIRPHIEKGLTNASASLSTGYGIVSSSWKMEDGKLLFDVEIPANTTAIISIPASNPESVHEGGKPLSSVKDLQISEIKNGFVEVKAGSGKYHFVVNQ